MSDDKHRALLGCATDGSPARPCTWRMVDDGIEHAEAPSLYPLIENERLLEKPEHSWPEHMAEKSWVNIADFIEVWLLAVTRLKERPDWFTVDWLADAIRKALSIKRRTG